MSSPLFTRHRRALALVRATLFLYPIYLTLPGVTRAAEVATPATAPDEGMIEGHVTDAHGAPLAAAKIELLNARGAHVAQAITDGQGGFQFRGILPGQYTLDAAKTGLGSNRTTIDVVAGKTSQTIVTVSAVELDAVTVTARRFERARNALSPSTGSSQYTLDAQAIDKLPEGDHTSFNQLLLQFPGVANDSFGQVHIRGDHNDLQYRLNGIILPEGVSGFGQVFDPRFAKSITLNTGALPAQYGLRTAGVIDITVKDRLDGGDVDVYGGSHGTINPSFQYGTSAGPFSGYATGQFLRSNLGVENPTPESNAIHDETLQGKGFAYGSYLLDPKTKIVGMLAATTTRFQIPDNPAQQADPSYSAALGSSPSSFDSTTIDERQFERNQYALVALQGVTGNDLSYQIATYDRISTVQFRPDVRNDLAFNGVAAAIKRKASTLGMQGDLSIPIGDSHTLGIGLAASTEDDRADNTSQVFTTDSNGMVNGGPVTIIDNNPKNGNTLLSLYVQDKWEIGKSLVVNYGLRYDRLNAFVHGQQLSPRLGLIDYLTPRTTLHAGYARYFTPPPNELVSSGSIAKFANTTNAPSVTQNSLVQPERAHYLDAGVTHQLTAALNLGLDLYYRYSRNLIDEGQFGQALIFTPFNYQQGHIYGAEFTANYHVGNFSAYANLARTVAQATRIVSSEFNFGQDELDYIATHYVYLDHDQRLTASAGASYQWLGTTLGIDGIYGSGLRKGFANTGKLIPTVQLNLSATRSVTISETFGSLDFRIAALNILDRSNEIRDGSGIGVGAPQYAPRAAVYFGIAKLF